MRCLFSVLIPLILFSAACRKNKPEGILPEKAMTSLLTEVHLLDGYLQTLPTDSAQRVIDTLYAQLFARYDLDSTSFAKNVNYYFADPTRTEAMYDNIQQDLAGAETILRQRDSVRYAQVRDSLNVVMHWQRLLTISEELLNFVPDSTYHFDFERYKHDLYRASNLQNLWPDSRLGYERRMTREAKTPNPAQVPQTPPIPGLPQQGVLRRPAFGDSLRHVN